MRPSRRLHPLLFPLLLVGACDGGGGGEVAQPHEMRIRIVSGKGMRATVVDSLTQGADAGVVPQPVVAQVYAELDAGGQDATGPAPGARLPATTIRWRALEPWCQPLLPTTPVAGDTASNRYRRATLADLCHLVAEGMVDGRVFDADTAAVSFEPGPVARYAHPGIAIFLHEFSPGVLSVIRNPEDAHGNLVMENFGRALSARLLSGTPGLRVDSDSMSADGEAEGVMSATLERATHTFPVWALDRLTRHDWRITWACYGLDLPDGTRADSVHYRLDADVVRYGPISGPGLSVAFTGTLTRREWMAGQPVRQSTVREASRSAYQRPWALAWSLGGVSESTPTGYAGGSLCEIPAQGAWERSGPVAAQRVP